MTTETRLTLDWASFGIVVGSLVNALPSIAAGLSVVWLLWQMYDKYQKQRIGN